MPDNKSFPVKHILRPARIRLYPRQPWEMQNALQAPPRDDPAILLADSQKIDARLRAVEEALRRRAVLPHAAEVAIRVGRHKLAVTAVKPRRQAARDVVLPPVEVFADEGEARRGIEVT